MSTTVCSGAGILFVALETFYCASFVLMPIERRDTPSDPGAIVRTHCSRPVPVSFGRGIEILGWRYNRQQLEYLRPAPVSHRKARQQEQPAGTLPIRPCPMGYTINLTLNGFRSVVGTLAVQRSLKSSEAREAFRIYMASGGRPGGWR
jgi:hypothetical protein